MSVYILFFLFTQIGMAIFGGEISSKQCPGNNLYFLMNFNDFGMSFVTLFQIMIINNWYVTTGMYMSCLGSKWPLLFFLLWYSVVIFLITNLVVAFFMEIYSDQSVAKQELHARYKDVQILHKQFDENKKDESEEPEDIFEG